MKKFIVKSMCAILPLLFSAWLPIAALDIVQDDPKACPEELCERACESGQDLFSMEKRSDTPRQTLWLPQGKECQNSDTPIKQSRASCPQPLPRTMPQTIDPVLGSGRPCPTAPSGGLKYSGALLIWQSKMWGFEFAGKSLIPTNAGTASVSLKEKVFVPDFAWRPGCKIDVGYDFGFDGWDLDSRWTFYRGEDTSLKKHFTSQIYPPGMGVVPLWFYPFYNVLSPEQIRFADGTMSWRHYFNSIDLEIGRSSSLTKRLSMRLFGGLKGAWMHQFYRVDYQDGTTISAIVPGTDGTVSFELLESAAAFKNETWGAGPRIGFDSKWKVLWGVSLITDASLSLLFSKIETHRDQNDLNLATSSNTQQPYHMYLKTDSHQIKPVAEAKLGLDWQTCICKSSIIGLTIAYELQYWWAQNELRRNYSHAEPGGMLPMRGDLQMHGLTAEVAYSY